MKEMICIVCPNGCKLIVDEKTKSVKGNMCPRGVDYAIQELTIPKRSVTTTVRTIFDDYPSISVKTDKFIEKKYIFKLIKELEKVVIKDRLPIGSIILKNVFNTDVNIITTMDIRKEN